MQFLNKINHSVNVLNTKSLCKCFTVNSYEFYQRLTLVSSTE